MTVTDPKRLPAALVTFVVWVAAVMFSMRWASDGAKKELVDTVAHGVSWNIVIAIAVLTAATALMRWRDLKFVSPQPSSSLRLLWFPVIYLIIFAIMAAVSGLPAPSVIFFVLINTILVGLSEEWMFRGVLFQGLRSRFLMWPSIILSCVLFGSVHVLNVFVTGNLGDAALQATTAAMSGLLFVALLVRTGSLWVPIAYHAVWDFCTFMVSAGVDKSGSLDNLPKLTSLALPLLLVLPNFLYALYLLRNIRNDSQLATDTARPAP